MSDIKTKKPPFEYRIVKLTGNFGSYNAFLAGLHYADGDVFAQLHADLQDPPKHIPDMLKHWENGYKLVIGQREERQEPAFKRLLSLSYHKTIRLIALPHIPKGGYDLIVFDKSIRNNVVNLNESNTNLVYLISSLKHPYVCIQITREKRLEGTSQWTFKKKIKLFKDSIISFSDIPIRIITSAAWINLLAWFIITIATGFNAIAISFFDWLFYTVLSGIFISLSVVAEYLWRTLEAARKRPPFIVDEIID